MKDHDISYNKDAWSNHVIYSSIRSQNTGWNFKIDYYTLSQKTKNRRYKSICSFQVKSNENSSALWSYWDLAVTVIRDGKGKHVSKMMYSCIHKFIMISFIGWFW